MTSLIQDQASLWHLSSTEALGIHQPALVYTSGLIVFRKRSVIGMSPLEAMGDAMCIQESKARLSIVKDEIAVMAENAHMTDQLSTRHS